MNIEAKVGNILRKRNMTMAVAESCTGGLISSRITDCSGSSDYFIMGIVAYSNNIKADILGISPRLLLKHGAVSKEIALEMARSARLLADTDIGIGVTGIAGPAGGTKVKPVGLVYIAVLTNDKKIVKEFRFKGSRKKIKFQASQAVLDLLITTVAQA